MARRCELTGKEVQFGCNVSHSMRHTNRRFDPNIQQVKLESEVLGRTIVELTTLWAVKMPWDRAPRPYPTDMGHECAAMIRNLVTGVHR